MEDLEKRLIGTPWGKVVERDMHALIDKGYNWAVLDMNEIPYTHPTGHPNIEEAKVVSFHKKWREADEYIFERFNYETVEDGKNPRYIIEDIPDSRRAEEAHIIFTAKR